MSIVRMAAPIPGSILTVAMLLSVIHIEEAESNRLSPKIAQYELLKPFKNLEDVALLHFVVPEKVAQATFLFAGVADRKTCPTREVHIHIQHGSFPLVSPDNVTTFPDNFYTGKTSSYKSIISTTYQSRETTPVPQIVDSPLPGSWFAMAYLANWNQKIQQQGLSHKCRYTLAAVGLSSQIADIPTIPTKATVKMSGSDVIAFRFYIDAGAWVFSIHVQCDSDSGPLCIEAVFIRPNALPNLEDLEDDETSVVPKGVSSGDFFLTQRLPFTNSYYYVAVVAGFNVSFDVTVSVKSCPLISGSDKNIRNIYSGKVNLAHVKPRVLSDFECDCAPIFPLTRFTHVGDFSDTFLLHGITRSYTVLPVTDTIPVGLMFEMLPYIDIGGNLAIQISLDLEAYRANSTGSAQELHVLACVRFSRPPEPLCCPSSIETNPLLCCESDRSLEISSEADNKTGDILFVPFPEPGSWYVSFNTRCQVKGTVVPCDVKEAILNVNINTQPCASNPGTPSYELCGKFGYCEKTATGQFSFTSCHCVGGYKGWTCADDSDASSTWVFVLSLLLPTLSNLCFLPAIIIAFRRKLFINTFIYTCAMVASTIYHTCDQEVYGYCIVDADVLQFADFFCAILAFWVTLIAIAHLPLVYNHLLDIVGAIVIAVGVNWHPTGLLVFLLPFSIGTLIIIGAWLYRSYKIKKLIRPTKATAIQYLPGVGLGALGLILFTTVQTEDNYMYVHSVWHIIISLSLVSLLPKGNKSVGPVIDSNLPPGSEEPVFSEDKSQTVQSDKPVSRDASLLYFHSQLQDIYS